METNEIAAWHVRREQLFAKPNGQQLRLDARTIEVMAAQLPAMQFDAACIALEHYRDAKPYRGFWWQTYLEHYRKAQTDSSPKAAAAAPCDHDAIRDAQALRDQGDEIAAYAALSDSWKAECRMAFAGWGIDQADGNRKWRLLCIDALNGVDVERYRIHRREAYQPPVKPMRNPYSIIEELRLQVLALQEELARARGETKLPA